MATLQIESEEVIDNRTIAAARADDAWTESIVASSMSDDFDVNASEISIYEDEDGTVVYEGPNEELLNHVAMSVVNCDKFWKSDTLSEGEVYRSVSR